MDVFIINHTAELHIQLAAKLFVHPTFFNIFSINSKTIVYTGLKFAQSKKYVNIKSTIVKTKFYFKEF